MKRFRKLISVLVVLVMALTAVCCAGGETATDLEKQILGTWDLTDIRGTGLGDDTIGTVMEMAKLMGGSILFTFRSGGVYSMEFSILGQNDSVDGTYTVSDGTISLDGAEMSCVVDGNEMYLGSGEGGAIVLTRLGGGVQPLGQVLAGFGNNGEDGTEGARYRNVFGTYSHGPLLPKNPALCDFILLTALQRKYGAAELSPLDDAAELAAHDEMAERI